MAALTANTQILRLLKFLLSSGVKGTGWLMERMVDGMAPHDSKPLRQDTESAPTDSENISPSGKAHSDE